MAFDSFVESLERLAEADLDPAELVYARLFAEHPETQALFIRDKDGQIRGSMLAQAIDALLDLAGPRHWGHHLIASERINHDGLGVPADLFAGFFGYLRDACRELLGEQWTEAMDRDWRRALEEIEALVA